MRRNLREPEEKPIAIVPDKAYFPLNCAGDGQPKMLAHHAPACPGVIATGSPFYTLHWKSEPHLSPHCRECREYFFAHQRKLGL